MDNNRDLDMESIIKNVECWYQEIAQKSKEEVDAFYQTRVSTKQPGCLTAAQGAAGQKCQLSWFWFPVSGASG